MTIKHWFWVHNAQNARLCTEDNIHITHTSSCFHSPEIVICQLIIIKSSFSGNRISVICLDLSSCYFHINKVHENWKCKYSKVRKKSNTWNSPILKHQNKEISHFWKACTETDVLSHYFKDFYVFCCGIFTITVHDVKLWMQFIL